ncbi:MAG: ECF transporter S component [Anaeromassilibacillus sp.]
MKLNLNERNTSVNLALTGLMAALVLVATMFFKVEIPVGTGKTMIGFANVFCILSGLLLGPVYGGLAAGIGSCIFDLMGGWADSAPTTLIFKFMMAFVCGLIAWGGDRTARALPRDCGCSGSLCYCVLYLGYSFLKLILVGSAPEAAAIAMVTKLAATLTNAIVADVIAVPFFFAIRKALERAHLPVGGPRRA